VFRSQGKIVCFDILVEEKINFKREFKGGKRGVCTLAVSTILDDSIVPGCLNVFF